MSSRQRKRAIGHEARRADEEAARRAVVSLCRRAAARNVPALRVAECLGLSDRTLRHWTRSASRPRTPADRGRPPRCAGREQRNQVLQFVKRTGPETPLVAVRAEFPQLRRAELADALKRYRRVQRRRARRHRSRLVWTRSGTVWAADFKEPREPLEGRYPAILSIRDLASHYQLVWQPLAEATAEAVQAAYTRLFAEQGPPLVLKTDNGGPFRADETKRLLEKSRVTPLYNPRRRPSYNGAVERANCTLSGYQAARAELHGRPGAPTCDDSAAARRLANDLARPGGWQGPTAGELWNQRPRILPQERDELLAAVTRNRAAVSLQFGFTADEPLAHYPQAAVDRRAVRDALVAQGLLEIHPLRKPRDAKRRSACDPQTGHNLATAAQCRGIIPQTNTIEPPTVGGSQGLTAPQAPQAQPQSEEIHPSTEKLSASGKN